MNLREKNTVSKMIHIYCRSKHGTQSTLCDDCLQLEKYAHTRLEHCTFGEDKPVCKHCSVHCYKPEYKEQIKEVMRFAGPRMLFYHPADALRHLWKRIRNKCNVFL